MSENEFIRIQASNLIASDSIIMSAQYLEQMRDYLSVIHDEFERLYNATTNDNFAMDIEYKITSDNRLVIKQARPWVSYVPNTDTLKVDSDDLSLEIFPNPTSDYIYVQCNNCDLQSLNITNITGKLIQRIVLSATNNLSTEINTWSLPTGIYIVSGISKNNGTYYSEKFVKK